MLYNNRGNPDNRLKEREEETRELIRKMRRCVDEDQFAELAEKTFALASKTVTVAQRYADQLESLAESSEPEMDLRNLSAINRSIEIASKAVTALSQYRKTEFDIANELVRTENDLNRAYPVEVNVNQIFPHQGNGNKSISPVLGELFGELGTPEEPKKLPENTESL